MKNGWIRWAAAAAALAVLTGCAAALVGGAAAGGYYVGKDERSAKQIAADAAITSSVKTRLIGDKTVKALDVNVDTRNNVVILRGRVSKADQRAAAERIARAVKGVKGVRNELRVESK
jgi:hyperosmotically inducible protein